MNILIKNAFKEYDGRRVLEVDQLTFESGKVYALMGLNGSGKSTLLHCTSGLDLFTCGEVFYNGQQFTASDRKNISVMTQKPYLFNCSVLDNIKLGMKFRKYSGVEVERKLQSYLPYFDIEALLYKNAKRLSGGEQAKVALLRTAVIETAFTFLDEPTASMDIESTLMAEKLIKNMTVGNRTVILVTHDLYQAERTADYIIFLDKGKVIEQGYTYEVFNSPKHKLVRQILKRGEEN